ACKKQGEKLENYLLTLTKTKLKRDSETEMNVWEKWLQPLPPQFIRRERLKLTGNIFGTLGGTVIAIVIDMANLEALKKSRKTDRAAFTKAYNKVEELISLEGVDISELEAKLNVLKVKSDRLEITHASILELLPEQDFEAEI
ncbi:hypothetical protein AVEN_91192-1, partial [Araneus ventricosus]